VVECFDWYAVVLSCILSLSDMNEQCVVSVLYLFFYFKMESETGDLCVLRKLRFFSS
jgi:hypothetical protein